MNVKRRRGLLGLYLMVIVGMAWSTSGCKARLSDSTPKVSNAQATLDYKAVFALGHFADPYPFCTATAVGPDVAVTAAHCLCDRLATSMIVWKDVRELGSNEDAVRVVASYSQDEYQCGRDLNINGPYDLAVLKFNQEFPHRMRLSTKPIESGDAVVLVGYGNTHLNDDQQQIGVGVKRVGQNVFKGLYKDGLIDILGDLYRAGDPRNLDKPGQNSATWGGDSGGPLLVGAKGIVGVLMGGAIVPVDGTKQKLSVYVDLWSTESRDFLSRAVANGYKLPATCCACTQRIYEDVPFWSDTLIDEAYFVPTIAVGDARNQGLCDALSLDTHSVLAGETGYKADKKRYRVLSECRVTEKRACEVKHGIEMLGS